MLQLQQGSRRRVSELDDDDGGGDGGGCGWPKMKQKQQQRGSEAALRCLVQLISCFVLVMVQLQAEAGRLSSTQTGPPSDDPSTMAIVSAADASTPPPLPPPPLQSTVTSTDSTMKHLRLVRDAAASAAAFKGQSVLLPSVDSRSLELPEPLWLITLFHVLPA